MPKQRFEALDAFRGVCALSVMFFHMRWADAVTELDFFRSAWVFVEFFFVLSGFVLAHGYGFKQNTNFKDFMTARFVRLYPLHFAMFSLVLLFQFISLAALKLGGLSIGPEPFVGQYGIQQILPNLTLLQSWTPYSYVLSFNETSWSISVEFYSYAILFLSIVLFRSFKALSWFLISLLSFTVILLDIGGAFDTAVRGLSCFFGGAATYVIYRKIAYLKPTFLVGSVLELGLVVAVYFLIQHQIDNIQVWSSFLFFVVVMAFAFESGVVSQLLSHRPFQVLGQLSYSIYLIHFVIILYLGAVFAVIENVFDLTIRLGPKTLDYNTFGSSLLNNIAVAVFVCIVLVCSKFTYEHIEMRAQRYYKNRKKQTN